MCCHQGIEESGIWTFHCTEVKNVCCLPQSHPSDLCIAGQPDIFLLYIKKKFPIPLTFAIFLLEFSLPKISTFLLPLIFLLCLNSVCSSEVISLLLINLAPLHTLPLSSALLCHLHKLLKLFQPYLRLFFLTSKLQRFWLLAIIPD